MTTRHAVTATCLGLLLTGVTACSSGPTGPTTPSLPPTSAPPAAALPTLGWPPPTSPVTPPRVFGTVTELTAKGPVPVEGVYIEYCGYDAAVTDADGFYQLIVPNGIVSLYVRRVPGFRDIAPVVTVNGETRFDLRLERE